MCDFCNGKESYKTAYGEFKIKKLGYINVIQCHIDKCPQYAKCCSNAWMKKIKRETVMWTVFLEMIRRPVLEHSRKKSELQ